MKITNGMLEGAPFIRSPNQGGRITPKFLSWHWTAGWTLESAISTLTTPSSRASAQFVMDWDGSITQLVSCERKAWHAGRSSFMGYTDLNAHAIGVEIVNPGFIWSDGKGGFLDWSKNHKISDALIRKHGSGMRKMRYPKIGSSEAFFIPFTDDQIESCKELTKAVCDRYDIIAANSHEEMDARGWKIDPGPLFPLFEMKALADKFEGRADGGSAPVNQTATVTASSLNMRDAPGGKVVSSVKKGMRVTIHEDRGDWALVSVQGQSRRLWVADRYLRYA